MYFKNVVKSVQKLTILMFSGLSHDKFVFNQVKNYPKQYLSGKDGCLALENEVRKPLLQLNISLLYQVLLQKTGQHRNVSNKH